MIAAQVHLLWKVIGSPRGLSMVARWTGTRPAPERFARTSLDRTGKAYATGDFPAFLACFDLPQVIESFDGQRVVSTPQDLKDVFDAVRAQFDLMGVTEMDRRCVDAHFVDADTIEYTHETRLLNKAILLRKPYPVFSVVRRVAGVWKVSHGKYAIDGAPRLSRIFCTPPDERARAWA